VLPLSALWQPDYRAAYLGVNIGYVTVVEKFPAGQRPRGILTEMIVIINWLAGTMGAYRVSGHELGSLSGRDITLRPRCVVHLHVQDICDSFNVYFNC
jgi:hypothetical protein